MRDKSRDYISNTYLTELLADYATKYKAAKAIGEETPRMSNRLGAAIQKMAAELATKRNFSGYSFREEMISDGIENCLRYLHNFNPEKTNNGFGYVTLILYRAFVRRIERERNHSYIKHKLILANSDRFEGLDGNTTPVKQEWLDKSGDVVRNFEQGIAKKKSKAKEK